MLHRLHHCTSLHLSSTAAAATAAASGIGSGGGVTSSPRTRHRRPRVPCADAYGARWRMQHPVVAHCGRYRHLFAAGGEVWAAVVAQGI